MAKGLPDDKYIETLEAEVSAYLERIRELEQQLETLKYRNENQKTLVLDARMARDRLEQENAKLHADLEQMARMKNSAQEGFNRLLSELERRVGKPASNAQASPKIRGAGAAND